MRLPDAPEKWTREFQARLNNALKSAIDERRPHGDIEMKTLTLGGVTKTERIILQSPNGTRYALTVNNAGTLSTTAV
jgi:hypothetical protein